MVFFSRWEECKQSIKHRGNAIRRLNMIMMKSVYGQSLNWLKEMVWHRDTDRRQERETGVRAGSRKEGESEESYFSLSRECSSGSWSVEQFLSYRLFSLSRRYGRDSWLVQHFRSRRVASWHSYNFDQMQDEEHIAGILQLEKTTADVWLFGSLVSIKTPSH